MMRHLTWLVAAAALTLGAAGGAIAGTETGGGSVTPGTGESGGSAAPAPSRIAGDPTAARPLYDQARQAYADQRYVEAARLFQRAYDAWSHPGFLYDKGQSLIRASQWEDALGAFRGHVTAFEDSGLSRDWFDPVVYVQIAECLHRLDRPEEAAQAMQRYLELSPQGPLAPGVHECIERGTAPSTIGERNPQTVDAARRIHEEAQDLVVRGQYREAAERYLQGYHQFNDITEFLYNAATAYRMARMWQDAIRVFQQYAQTPAPEPEAFIELAQCLHQLHNYDEAVAAYRRYLELEPQGTFAQDAREYIQSMTSGGSGGSGAPSQESIERARQHFERGASHYADGRYQEALQEFSQAYDLFPMRGVEWNMAMCHLRLREWARALTAFENYLRGGDAGPDAEAHLAAAECELELRQPDRARQHIEDYLRRADALELPDEEANRRRAEQLMERVRQAAPGGGS